MDMQFEEIYRRPDGSVDIEFYRLRAAARRSRTLRRSFKVTQLVQFAPYVLAIAVGLAAGVMLPVAESTCATCRSNGDLAFALEAPKVQTATKAVNSATH